MDKELEAQPFLNRGQQEERQRTEEWIFILGCFSGAIFGIFALFILLCLNSHLKTKFMFGWMKGFAWISLFLPLMALLFYLFTPPSFWY